MIILFWFALYIIVSIILLIFSVYELMLYVSNHKRKKHEQWFKKNVDKNVELMFVEHEGISVRTIPLSKFKYRLQYYYEDEIGWE